MDQDNCFACFVNEKSMSNFSFKVQTFKKYKLLQVCLLFQEIKDQI